MATSSLCFNSIHPCTSSLKQGTVIGSPVQKSQYIGNGSFKVCMVNLQLLHAFGKPKSSKRQLIQAKAAEGDQGTKQRSIICGDCDGNGIIQCSQCKGSGVNSVDHFNGQFKAGGLCWLCRGKREILCGNCNGAGFMGGFMSTQDE